MKLTIARSRAVTAAAVFFEVYVCSRSDNDPLDLTEEAVMLFYDQYAIKKKELTTQGLSSTVLKAMFSQEVMRNSIDDEFLSAVKSEVRNIVRGLLATWTITSVKKNKG